MVFVEDPKLLGLIALLVSSVTYLLPFIPKPWARLQPLWLMRFAQWVVISLVTYHMMFSQHDYSSGTSAAVAWAIATSLTLPFTVLDLCARQAGKMVGPAVLVSTLSGSAIYTVGQSRLSDALYQAAVFAGSLLVFSVICYLAYRKGTPTDSASPSNLQVAVRLLVWTAESSMLGLLLITSIRQAYNKNLDEPERLLSLEGDTQAWVLFCVAAVTRTLLMVLGMRKVTENTKFGQVYNALTINPYKPAK